VQRLLMNLKGAYLRTGDFPRAVRVIQRLRQLNPTDAHEQRDLGISLFHAGESGKAIDHLSSYLKTCPESTDADTVRQLLNRARSALAPWN
jgi:regulator of sirC expression with transglutaminase-like and TPR domain